MTNERVREMFADMLPHHAMLDAALSGTGPCEMWVDDPDNPHIAFVIGAEGGYLAGDMAYEPAYDALREFIPAQMTVYASPEWEAVLPRIWVNRAARRHDRLHYLYLPQHFDHWRGAVPEGVQIRPVDAALIAQTDLRNHEHIIEWIDGSFESVEAFLERGWGVVAQSGDVLAAWSLTDCVVRDRCEIGIISDGAYRRRGLSSLVVSAMLDIAKERGITEVGWQCLASNKGSRALAEKMGFARHCEVVAFSAILPSENAGDLTADEYRDWAQHYEQFTADEHRYVYRAARTWALAGDHDRALPHLRALAISDWAGDASILEGDFAFDGMRGAREFEAVMQQFRARVSN